GHETHLVRRSRRTLASARHHLAGATAGHFAREGDCGAPNAQCLAGTSPTSLRHCPIGDRLRAIGRTPKADESAARSVAPRLRGNDHVTAKICYMVDVGRLSLDELSALRASVTSEIRARQAPNRTCMACGRRFTARSDAQYCGSRCR